MSEKGCQSVADLFENIETSMEQHGADRYAQYQCVSVDAGSEDRRAYYAESMYRIWLPKRKEENS